MYEIIFIIEFAFLFLLAKTLVNSFASLCFKITKSKRLSIIIIALIFFPGTVLHELAHLLIAGLLFVKTNGMELVPKVSEDQVRLGSVEIEKTDPLRRALIGVAPVLLGLAVIFTALIYFQAIATNWLIGAIFFYIIFTVGNTLFSSQKDLEGCIEFVLAVVILTTALFIIRPDLWRAFFNIWQSKQVISYFKLADKFLVVPIILDLIIIFVVKILIGKTIRL